MDDSGRVVQFLSYEGTFAAIGGPATGCPAPTSAFRELEQHGDRRFAPAPRDRLVTSEFAWASPAPNTFGSCNTGPDLRRVAGPNDPVINEFVANHTGYRHFEFVEVSAIP